MKKILITFCAILIGLFAVMTMINFKDEYMAGRSLWLLNRQYAKFAQRAESATNTSVERLADKYRRYLKEYPQSVLQSRAQIIIGNIYQLDKNYPKAREEYAKVMANYPKDGNACAEALASIAGIYETEGNWPQALKTYKEITRKYSMTEVGFQIPMLLARNYMLKKDTDNADKAYKDASVFYRGMALKYPKTMVEFSALRILIMAELDQEHWQSALETAGELMEKYPAPKVVAQMIPVINQLSVLRLRNYDLAITIYQRFIEHHPKHPANKVLGKLIESLKKLKIGSVKIELKK